MAVFFPLEEMRIPSTECFTCFGGVSGRETAAKHVRTMSKGLMGEFGWCMAATLRACDAQDQVNEEEARSIPASVSCCTSNFGRQTAPSRTRMRNIEYQACL